MKPAAIFLAFLDLTSFACFGGVVSDIPPEKQVTLEKVDYSYVSSTLSSSWMPEVRQTRETLAVIQAYLDRSTDEKSVTCLVGEKVLVARQFAAQEIAKIRANKAGYRVQFWGVMQNGKKLIFCNFFPAVMKYGNGTKDEFEKWQREVIFVDDGGYYFWQVLYDPETHKVVQFDCNGYASLGTQPSRYPIAGLYPEGMTYL